MQTKLNMRGSTLNDSELAVLAKQRERDYFFPPHGGRPPSDAAVHAATQRYINSPGGTPAPRKLGRKRVMEMVK